MEKINDQEKVAEETPFNMASLYYQGLNQLIQSKDQAFLNEEMEKWDRGLTAIYHKIIFKLSPEEKDKMNNLLEEGGKDLKERGNIYKLLQFDKELMIIMDKYKMIFPEETDKSHRRMGE